MSHPRRSILTRSPCASNGLRIASIIRCASIRNSISRLPRLCVLGASPANSVSNSFRIRSYEKSAHKFFRIRSYRIPRGGGVYPVPNFHAALTRARNSFRIRSYENRVRKSFRIRSYKIPRGVGAFAFPLRDSALSASQRYPSLRSLRFSSHTCAAPSPLRLSTVDCRLPTPQC
jgi:hypothetical protein